MANSEKIVFVVDEQNRGKRLDIFLCENLGGISRSQIKNLIDKNEVFVGADDSKKAGYILRLCDQIVVNKTEESPSTLEPQDIKIDIVFEDDYIVVVNKPQGLVVHPGNGNKDGTMVNALLFLTKVGGGEDFRPGIVHRIDKDTSGLVVVAKDEKTHKNLSDQIKARTMKRQYIAVVDGVVKEPKGIIKTNINRHKKDRTKMAVSIDGKEAITNFEVKCTTTKHSLVHFSLHTGRTHQIRVHCAHIRHPVTGDKVYGKAQQSLDGQLLHAYSLQFVHPSSKKLLTFTANPPNYFLDFCDKHGIKLPKSLVI